LFPDLVLITGTVLGMVLVFASKYMSHLTSSFISHVLVFSVILWC